MPLIANTPRRSRSFSTLLALLAAVLVVPSFARTASAQPEPDPIPTKWEFRFEPGPLRMAMVDVDGVGVQRYFYFTYRITNYWDNDLLFAPDVELRTSDATVSRSGREVPRQVTQDILGRLDNPLMEDPLGIVGQVLQGPENARDGVVIWPAQDLDVDEVSIFFGGLSGETRVYETGSGDDARRFTLRKTMMLRYETPGNFGEKNNQVLPVTETRWIMR